MNGHASGGGEPVRASGVGPPVPDAADPDVGDHLGDLVVDLASGSLADADPSAVLAHLDRCPRCRSELTDAVVAAAALRSERPAPESSVDTAAATLPPLGLDPRVGPGPEWSRPVRPSAGTATADAGSRRRARGPRPREAAGHRRRALALTAAAALAVGVLVGGGVATTRRPVATPPAAVTVLLRSGAVTRGAAVITAAGGQRKMTITAGVTQRAAGGGPSRVVLTVWLTRPDGHTAQRVGVLDGAGRGSFAMSAATAAQYPRVVLTASAAPVAALDPAAVVATAQLS